MADESASRSSPDILDNSSMSEDDPDEAAPEQNQNDAKTTNENVESPLSKVIEESKVVAATAIDVIKKEELKESIESDDDDDEEEDDTEMEENALRIDYDDESFEENKSNDKIDVNGSGKKEHGSSHAIDSVSSGEKRKLIDTDWSSEDEEAFVGFSDSIGENSSRLAFISGRSDTKKIKSELSSPIKVEIKSPKQERKLSPKKEEIKPDLKVKSPSIENIPPVQVAVPPPSLTPQTFNKKGRILPPSDPIYRIPFEYGWKRELVLRAIPEVSKEKGEVYYITPAGKKLRTRNEIFNHLPKDGVLSMEHFTFSKESLGVSPEFEVIRSAKLSSSTIRRTNFDMTLDVNATSMGKRIPKPKVPKGASPPPINRLAMKSNRIPQVARDSKDGKISDDGGKTPKSKSEPCTIQCFRAMGTIPQLQCKKCLCLYHHECVGLGSSTSIVESYVCQGCRPPEMLPIATPPVPPPPPAPIPPAFNENSSIPKDINCASSSTSQQSVPKIEKDHKPFTHHHHNINRGGNSSNSNSTKENVVDSLTTWHYNTANISTNRNNLNKFETPPQSIASINGRKFIIVPKTNVLSVSPSNEMKSHNQDDARGENSPPAGTHNPDNGGIYGSGNGDGGNGGVIGNGDYNIKSQSSNENSKHRRGHSSNSERANKSTTEVEHQTASTQKFNNNVNVIGGKSRLDIGNSLEVLNQSGVTASLGDVGGNCSRQFFSNVSVGYNVLLHTFQYLKVQELLRAACVCRLWNQIANHPSLWRTVRLKNSQVNDWNGLASTLIRNGARHLDLRKMLSPSNITTEESWIQFSKIIGDIRNLESIDLCKCSTSIVEHLFESNCNLKVINALTLKDDVLNLQKVSNLKNLQELRLKSSEGLIVDDITPLRGLTSIQHLSLTSIKELGTKNIEVLGELVNIESLELGECTEFNNSFVENVLLKLTSLQRLRLEKGQNNCSTFEILSGIAKMEHLVQLELINFDVRTEFDDYISKCIFLKKLLIIPTYVSQSATTNQIVLNGVMQLAQSLDSFTWAVTGELVRVTELYVDNCDANKRSKKSLSDCIPVLKPVPGILDSTQIMSKRVAADVPQVEILPLTSVEKILHTAMPQTSVHMVIIPYHATWRQNLVEN